MTDNHIDDDAEVRQALLYAVGSICDDEGGASAYF